MLGGVLAASEGERVIAGAVAGAGGAAIGTYGGYAARVALGRIIPEPLPGTIEDALAITLAMAAARR